MSAMADFTLGEKEIEEAGYTCLHELLRRVPSVYIKEEKVYIRAITSIYGDNPAAIAIDGVIMPEEYDLDNSEIDDRIGADGQPAFRTDPAEIIANKSRARHRLRF